MAAFKSDGKVHTQSACQTGQARYFTGAEAHGEDGREGERQEGKEGEKHLEVEANCSNSPSL